MPTLDIVGKPNIRYDAIPKADGSMPYGEDKIPAGALHTGVLYTPVPHGKLNNIDTRAAENIPGVAIVITAKDIPGKNFRFGPNTATLPGQPVLVEAQRAQRDAAGERGRNGAADGVALQVERL